MFVSIKFILFCFLLSLGLNSEGVFAQENKSFIKKLDKRSLIVSANGIYNYFTGKTLVTMILPDGRIPNSVQKVYYWQYKYYDTYTFDLSVQYNRFLTKKFSLSTGIRFSELKEFQKTHRYIDSSANLPDYKETIYSRYSFSLPLSGNFYLKRFRFSFGLYAHFLTLSKSVHLYENNLKKKYFQFGPDLEIFAQESVAFKLLKNKDIYLQVGAIQGRKFWRDYGYYNFFTFGLSIESLPF